jgi:protein-S-isoprenylcysteine O-methyltransferase Ste14
MSAKKPLPPAYLFICLVATLTLHFLFPIVKIIRGPYVLLGIPLIIFGVVLNIWADGLFKRENTTVKPFETPSALITEGPFRLSRHPMYLGFVSILLGVAVMLGSLVAFLGPIALFITLEALFIPHEERSLEGTFRGEYVEYKRHVRQWL